MRAIGAALLVSVALFALLVLLAIQRYPGGTWFDPRAPGHDIFRNFLCDLTQPIALNGQRNPGFGLAKAAMIVLDVGLLCLFWVVTLIAAPSRLTRPLRVLAAISFAGIIAVPLTPSLELGAIHTVAVLAGAIPGVLAGVVAMVLLRRTPHRWLFLLGAAAIAVAAVDVAIYAVNAASHAPPALMVPVLQRLSLVLLLAWMTTTALTLLRGIIER